METQSQTISVGRIPMEDIQITVPVLRCLQESNKQVAELTTLVADMMEEQHQLQCNVSHLRSELAVAKCHLTDANTALEALVAERTELQTQLTDALAQLTQLRSQTIAREDRPQHDPLAELLKTHYRLGPDDVIDVDDVVNCYDPKQPATGLVNMKVGPCEMYRPIPTNIPLPDGAKIPNGYCALEAGAKVPEGAKYWADLFKHDGDADWTKSDSVGMGQDPFGYYIRPAKEVSNG